MSYECEECGASFDTLSRLRLHDCPVGLPDEVPPDVQTVEEEYASFVGDLPSLVEDAKDGDLPVLYRAVAEYETALADASASDEPRSADAHHEILFEYYEPLAEGLDAAAQANGWDMLVEFVDAYSPREQDRLPEVAHVIANAVGRNLVRTRLSEGIESVPPDALAYLGAIPEYVGEFSVAYEESYTYGWGIGHPEHSVRDQLRALADTNHKWVSIALSNAFYADQRAAVDTLEQLVTDDSLTGTVQRMTFEADVTRYYFGAVSYLELEKFTPHIPQYWEWEEELDYTFELDPEVEQQIRDLAHETGVTDDLPDDWTLQDLEPGPLSQLRGIIGESSGEEL